MTPEVPSPAPRSFPPSEHVPVQPILWLVVGILGVQVAVVSAILGHLPVRGGLLAATILLVAAALVVAESHSSARVRTILGYGARHDADEQARTSLTRW